MENPTLTFAPNLLRAIRAKLDLTQEELAERLGVSFATVVGKVG
jgi:type I restriction enzyme M protein